MMRALILSLPLLITSCSWINQKLNLQDDNLLEEVVEDVIDHKTGVKIDLTPNSKEPKK